MQPGGRGTYLPRAQLPELEISKHKTPEAWRLAWAGPGVSLEARIRVKPTELLAAWGSPIAPRSQEDFIILPLVLDAEVTVRRGGTSSSMKGYGLAEFFNADFWPV